MELLLSFFGDVLQSELAKFTFLFLLAAEIHKRAVKKEMALLRGSIDHLAEVMGKKFDDHEDRLRRLEEK